VTEVKEKVKQIQINILATQSRQKSYTDKRRNPLEFEVGDHVYLRVSPMKGVRRFGIKGKLAPRYIGPYSIIDKYGPLSPMKGVCRYRGFIMCFMSPNSRDI
jgi:hypothetical protein